MKLIVTAAGPTLQDRLDPHFGRTSYLLCFDTESASPQAESNSANAEAAGGAGIQTAAKVSQLGARAVITGDVGPKASHVLNSAGVEVYLADEGMTVAEAIEQWKAGSLRKVEQPTVGAHRTR